MYNLGDDSELDRLSREAAGRYETPGNANWQALSEELDKGMPEEKKKRRFLFWWILPGLLAGGAITYAIIKQDKNTTVATEKNIPAVSTDKSTEQSTTSNNNPTNEPAVSLTDKKATTPTEKPVTIASPQIKESTTALISEGKTGISINSARKAGNKSGLNNTRSAARTAGKTETGSTPAPSPVVNPEVSKVAEQPMVIKEQKEITKENNPTEKAEQALTPSPAKTEKEPATEEPVIKEDKKTVQQNSLPARGKGWSFGLLAGVDKSTVKFKYGYKPGINLGLEVAYHFNDTWAVKTGGIYTQKNYKLAGEDFTAPKGSWASYYKLDQVEGYCRMWEVPLLVSYTLHNNGKKSVTLNTGLSSYFMTKEDYDYYYYFNSAPATRNFSYNSTDTHVLSIVHLSAGFENRLSNTMSLQVEPYAKIPLGGVGFGSIRLSSFGVNFSVQYRQPHKK